LKSDTSDGILPIDYCQSTDTICIGQSISEDPFFFVYSYIFSDLHVVLPFDEFTMDILQSFNVAPSQLHPNTWASLQTFCLICNMFRLSLTPATFLSYYTSHSVDLVSRLSLISQSGNILFSPYTTSYKNFKGNFFKLFIEPEGWGFFLEETGLSQFPLYQTKTPTQFKEWPHSTPDAEELEICSLLTTSLEGSLHGNY